MTDTAIKVENLSKAYRIGTREHGKTFREMLTDAAKAPFQRIRSTFRRSPKAAEPENRIWALKEVSFEVKQGEVVGIIGRNGAGKSTLLKILSRITEPTAGRVELRGRMGSLLEVGVGFHSELTGHENIYLYGAILGMNRFEITRKFDEIVAFAELEQFVDTPVKKYSTGMYMRLAFAVAAHLEPEILLVDEVLAVGDAAFQKKCLGKMGEISKQGRTVLFVSHNMGAVQALCSTGIHLDAGQIKNSGNVTSVMNSYLMELSDMTSEVQWNPPFCPGNDELKLLSLRVYSENNNRSGIYSSRSDIYVEMTFVSHTTHNSLCVGFDLTTSSGEVLARSYQTDLPPDQWLPIRLGINQWICRIPKGLLNAGIYGIAPKIGMHNMYWIINGGTSVRFEVILDHGVSPFWNSLTGRNRPGMIAPIFEWIAGPESSRL